MPSSMPLNRNIMMFSKIQSLSRQINILEGKRDQIKSSYKELKDKYKSLQNEIEYTEKALTISQIVAQKTQEELQYQISEIVSMALSSIFSDPYEFKVIFEIKRGKTEARIVFVKDGNEFDPMTASGGGVVDVAAFALRLSCFLITRPRPSSVIVLDEPFRFVSKEYQPLVAELVEELANKLGIQFIIVTHEEELVRGNIIKI